MENITNSNGAQTFRDHNFLLNIDEAKERLRGVRSSTISVGIEYFFVVVMGLAVALVLADEGAIGTVTAVGIAAALLVELVSLPAYDRPRSMRPVRHIVMLAGALLLSFTALGLLDTRSVRAALMVVASAMAIPFAARLSYPGREAARTSLLIGDRVAVSHLIAQWRNLNHIDIAGICLVEPDDDVERLPAELLGVPVLGRLSDVVKLACERGVDQVVVAPGPVLTAYDVRRLSWALEDCSVELTVAAEVHGAVPGRIEPRLLGRRLVLSVRPTRRPAIMVWVKSATDRFVALVLLVLALPMLAVLVILIRWDSPGGGFYRQTRVGRHGRLFTMLKLRTMWQDADNLRADLIPSNEAAGPLFKMWNDPRVTRVGNVMRRTSLDELPQLINVLKGQMSLIGPRPALPPETSEYDDWIRRRLRVKPGMTGLWQVSGRSRLTWTEAVRLDLDYVDNWTLRGDVAIAARTVRAIVRPDGAA